MQAQTQITDILTKRIDLIYDALGATKKQNLRGHKFAAPRASTAEDDLPAGSILLFDANDGRTDANLHNSAHTLIGAIASIKDHFKVWCKENFVEFTGERVLNGKGSASIVHDLWNIDKHNKLNTKSRSGFIPKLTNLRQSLKMTTFGNQPAVFGIDIIGSNSIASANTTNSMLEVDGDIVDDKGNYVGSLQGVSEKAIAEWEVAIEATRQIVAKR